MPVWGDECVPEKGAEFEPPHEGVAGLSSSWVLTLTLLVASACSNDLMKLFQRQRRRDPMDNGMAVTAKRYQVLGWINDVAGTKLGNWRGVMDLNETTGDRSVPGFKIKTTSHALCSMECQASCSIGGIPLVSIHQNLCHGSFRVSISLPI